jgi:hypothetical protein
MLQRAVFAVLFALAALNLTTGVSSAALDLDRTEVEIWTIVVALLFMAFLFVAYLIKHAFGLDRMPPAEPEAADHGHH